MGAASVNLHFAPSHRESQTLTHSPSSIHVSNIALPTLNSGPSVWIRTEKTTCELRERYLDRYHPLKSSAYSTAWPTTEVSRQNSGA